MERFFDTLRKIIPEKLRNQRGDIGEIKNFAQIKDEMKAKKEKNFQDFLKIVEEYKEKYGIDKKEDSSQNPSHFDDNLENFYQEQKNNKESNL